MAESISLLSSDEDDSGNSVKRPKLNSDSIVILDDDEVIDQESDKYNFKEKINKPNFGIKCYELTDGEDNKKILENYKHYNVSNSGTSHNVESKCSNLKNANTLENKVDIIDLLDVQKDNLNLDNNVLEIFKDYEEMQQFVSICLSHLQDEKTRDLFKSKIQLLRNLFDKVGSDYTQSSIFKKELIEKISISKISSCRALQCFNDMYVNLKAQKTYKNCDKSVCNKQDLVIKKLERALNKIRKKIRVIEKQEVDFEEEEDSSFMKLYRYRERAVKLYQQLCKYRKEDPHTNHILFNRLDFSASKIPEINKAINKKFKNNTFFPTYYDVETCLRKCVTNNNIQMSEASFKLEASNCFEKLGNLLQHRRKVDLLNVHNELLVSNQDPADEDEELNKKLIENYHTGQNRIDSICSKYAHLQEAGNDPRVSSDSDDSHLKSENEEEEL